MGVRQRTLVLPILALVPAIAVALAPSILTSSTALHDAAGLSQLQDRFIDHSLQQPFLPDQAAYASQARSKQPRFPGASGNVSIMTPEEVESWVQPAFYAS